MKFPTGPNRDAAFWLTAALALVVGFRLQVSQLAEQVLLDDEWHSLYFVIGKSPGWLLTHFSIPGATCIPQNLWNWALLHTVGWSEIPLRLPSLLAGLLCLVVGPWLASVLVGPRRAALLALLLAVSPLLIFYSRLCRPYSAVALLAFAALLLAARWMQTGARRAGLLFVATGALAVYFHLFAVVAVAAPVLGAVVCHCWRRAKNSLPPDAPPLRHWLAAGAAIAGISALLAGPALWHSLHSTFFAVAGAGTLRWSSVPRVSELISGTAAPVLAGLFWLAVVAGAIQLCRRQPWFGGVLVGLFPLHALALVVSHPDSAQSAIVLVRYSIVLLPVSLLLAAGGIQATLELLATRVALRPGLQAVLAVAGVATYALAGPLPQIYAAPNSFTNHGAFQHRYATIDWRRSFVSDLTPADFSARTTIGVDEISRFYDQLAAVANGRPVVEYPMVVGDQFNPLYYYQHFHHRPVLVGYLTNLNRSFGLAAGNIFGNTYIDQVLGLVPDAAQRRFRNVVSLHDPALLRARGAEFLILHKTFEGQLSVVATMTPVITQLATEYQTRCGPPVFEDDRVVVFRL